MAIVIENISQLQKIGRGLPLDGEYELTKDIDASETREWNDGKGFEPIGGGTLDDSSLAFRGKLDGKGHVIKNLYINRPNNSYVGLFGIVRGFILNLRLEEIHITGEKYVGGLAGLNTYGNILHCVSKGTISGDTFVGGLLGWSQEGKVDKCYTFSKVIGRDVVGGLIGRIWTYETPENSLLIESYSLGFVRGRKMLGDWWGGMKEQY